MTRLSAAVDKPDPDWVIALLDRYCTDQEGSEQDPVNIQLSRFGIDAHHVRAACEDARIAGYFNEDVRDGVRALWAFGFDTQEISRLLSLTAETVRQAVSESRWSGEERKAIRLHIDGLTPLEISAVLGKTRGWVYYIFEIHGVTPHRKNRAPTDRHQKREIVRRYDTGDSAMSIAADLRLEPHQVYWTVAKARMDGQRIRT